ncbi:MAG: Gfo/Idh/MocA family oxidoreductase [Pirellulales bacterium]
MHRHKNTAAKNNSGDEAHSEGGFSRRDFLRGGVAAGVAGGAGLGAVYFGYSSGVRDAVRVGVIGTGDEGGVLIGAINPDYVQVVAVADIRPYNIHRAFHGDESSESALKSRPGLIRKYGYANETEARKHIEVYGDRYEELLDDENVEGVIVALPLHLHAQAAIKAMRKGRHVLCEKLMAHSVHECKEMARVAEDQDKILAVGHQRHYSVLYDNAKQMIRRGVIGEVHHIRAQWHRGNLPGKDSWQQPLPGDSMKTELGKYAAQSTQLLDELNGIRADDETAWDASLSGDREVAEKARRLRELRMLDLAVKAEDYGYRSFSLGKDVEISAREELIRWRLWNRTGGGLMAELGSHQLDAASIFISALRDDGKKVLPLSVAGVGGRHIFPLDREVEDHVYCSFEFPVPDEQEFNRDPANKRIVVSYSSINGNGFGGYGEAVMGTGGTIVIERERDIELYTSQRPTSVQTGKASTVGLDTTESGAPEVAESQGTGPVSRGYTEEIEHWAWCIRNRQDPDAVPRCGPETALADATMALVANRAIEDQHKIEFDPNWFDMKNDDTPEHVKPNVERKEYSI